MSDYLIHYGVKGMKWGIRKSPIRRKGLKYRTVFNSPKFKNLTGSSRSEARSKYRGMDIDKMSDRDLQMAVSRMNLERQYRSLTKIDIMRGQRYAQDALKYNTTYKAVSKTVTGVAK